MQLSHTLLFETGSIIQRAFSFVVQSLSTLQAVQTPLETSHMGLVVSVHYVLAVHYSHVPSLQIGKSNGQFALTEH